MITTMKDGAEPNIRDHYATCCRSHYVGGGGGTSRPGRRTVERGQRVLGEHVGEEEPGAMPGRVVGVRPGRTDLRRRSPPGHPVDVEPGQRPSSAATRRRAPGLARRGRSASPASRGVRRRPRRADGPVRPAVAGSPIEPRAASSRSRNRARRRRSSVHDRRTIARSSGVMFRMVIAAAGRGIRSDYAIAPAMRPAGAT